MTRSARGLKSQESGNPSHRDTEKSPILAVQMVKGAQPSEKGMTKCPRLRNPSGKQLTLLFSLTTDYRLPTPGFSPALHPSQNSAPATSAMMPAHLARVKGTAKDLGV